MHTRRGYAGFLLVSFFMLSTFLFQIGVLGEASAQTSSVSYYVNANNSSSLCSGSVNALGTLDSTSNGPASVTLNTDNQLSNIFCADQQVEVNAPISITSVTLTLYVCCVGRTKYSVLAQLVDASDSPNNVLASSINPLHVSVDGISCLVPTKISLNIPVANGAVLSSGQTLLLRFQFSGRQGVSLCTGSEILQYSDSSLVISGMTQDSTTTSTSEIQTSTTNATIGSMSKSSTTNSTLSTSTTSTIQNSLSISNSSTVSSNGDPNVQGSLLPNIGNSFFVSSLIVGVVILVSSVIALSGKRN
ncbi:MAG TPA: hypothetical protein VJN71_00940 [Nitrososphaerales archaeon]|nr:hypothetical protein [Nitrososphaerales archaeon]